MKVLIFVSLNIFVLSQTAPSQEYQEIAIQFPLLHDAEDKRTLEIPVRIWESTSTQPPIFYLGGGPGESNFNFRPYQQIREKYTFVSVGFRGVDGQIRLDCPEIENYLKSNYLSAEGMTNASQQCANRLKSEGVDLQAFNMIEVVNDLEFCRIQLGYPKINLLSGSYGTRLAMLYQQIYPNSIHRSIMVAANPPGHMVWRSEMIDQQLAIYGANLPDLFSTVLEELPTRWFGLTIDPIKTKIATFCPLFHRDSALLTIDAYEAAGRGDYSGVALISLSFDYLLPEMLTWGDFISKAASSADFDHVSDVERESAMGSPLTELFLGAIDAWPENSIDHDFAQLTTIAHETLVLSGNVDFSTPSDYARDELLPSLSKGHHIVLQGYGHTSDLFFHDSDAAVTLIDGFFAHGTVTHQFETRPLDMDISWPLTKIAKTALVVLGSVAVLLVIGFWMLNRRFRLLHRFYALVLNGLKRLKLLRKP